MRTMRIAEKLKGWVQAALAVALLSAVAACGGGGDDSPSSSSGSGTSGSTSGLPASPTQQPIAATAANTVAITVGPGATGVINIPTVSVTLCVPGTTTTCQTINNVQVDTGSFGLRVVNSVLNTTMQTALQPSILSGSQLAECATFADGYTWGTVRTATIKIGGETTSTAIPVQIIGDKDASTVPAACSNTGGSAENTVSDLGANGILGIGTALTDCGSTCANPATAVNSSNYFACPGGTSCTRAAVPVAQQVANPVANFPTDNNGVIVQMPPIPDTGAASATGTLVFGIGTQSNNALAAANTFTTDAFGDLTRSVFNGATVTAFLDSGSNGYFFADSSLTLCGSNFSGFYCPSSAQTRSITLVGANNVQATANIGILSASTLFGSGNKFAYNDLAGQLGSSTAFDLGLPFFYGRYVYHGFDKRASGGQAPYVAF